MTINSMERMFQEELRDIYDAEKRLTKALPKMAKAAQSEELKAALKEHLQVTTNQVGRLEQIFQAIGTKASGKPCAGMKGLIEEGEEVMAQEAEEPFGDLAIIGAARRVEHYEMAAYLTLQGLAQKMDNSQVEELINSNLREENEADETLSDLFQSLSEQIESMDDESMETSSREGISGNGSKRGASSTASKSNSSKKRTSKA